jgi:hypothetical protein
MPLTGQVTSPQIIAEDHHNRWPRISRLHGVAAIDQQQKYGNNQFENRFHACPPCVIPNPQDIPDVM